MGGGGDYKTASSQTKRSTFLCKCNSTLQPPAPSFPPNPTAPPSLFYTRVYLSIQLRKRVFFFCLFFGPQWRKKKKKNRQHKESRGKGGWEGSGGRVRVGGADKWIKLLIRASFQWRQVGKTPQKTTRWQRRLKG